MTTIYTTSEAHIFATEDLATGKWYRSIPVTDEDFTATTRPYGLPPGVVAYHQNSTDWKGVLDLPLHPLRKLEREVRIYNTNTVPPLRDLSYKRGYDLVAYANKILTQDYNKMGLSRRETNLAKLKYCLKWAIAYAGEYGVKLSITYNEETGKHWLYYDYLDILKELGH